MRHLWSGIVALVAVMGLSLPAEAHCDAVDGPVAVDVRAALTAQDVIGVLKWVDAEDAQEVRQVFAHALRVRALDEDAAALADRYFMETVVRLHRQSEGAAFTGLKPAGLPLSPAVAAVDNALAQGSAEELVHKLQHAIAEAVLARYQAAHHAAAQAGDDVEAGREAVHAYVELVHFVKHLHDRLSSAPGGDDAHTAHEAIHTH